MGGVALVPTHSQAWPGQDESHKSSRRPLCPSCPTLTRRRKRKAETLGPCSPVEHLEDNGYLVIHPQYSDLAEAAEESSEGCLMPWERRAEVDSLGEDWGCSPSP